MYSNKRSRNKKSRSIKNKSRYKSSYKSSRYKNKSRNKIAVKSNPKLWEEIKNKYIMGSKGGIKGKNSARKMQLAVKEYKQRGGKYVGGVSKYKTSLKKWTEEKWDYISPRSGKSKRGRYLPEKVRKILTPIEKRRENRRKGSRRGSWIKYSESINKKMRKVGIY